MTMNITGGSGEQNVTAATQLIQGAFAEVRQQFGDDVAQTEMFIKLAYQWLYYLKNEVITVEALVRDYGVLREASPKDIVSLRDRLKQYGA